MIVEHEVIEQIEDEPLGRDVAWICELIQSLGRDDPFQVLRGMWQAGYVQFVDREAHALPKWKCAAFFRNGILSCEMNVVATRKGGEWVHGPC